MKGLFDYDDESFDDPDEQTRERPRPADNRCTPAKLEAFCRTMLREHGRFPTLLEIKNQFGGLLGAYVDAWNMNPQTWKELLRLKTSRERGGCATENP